MWILGTLGQHIQVTYDAAGYLVDAYGNWYESDGGSVYDDAGAYVGQLQTSTAEWLDEKVDAVIDIGDDALDKAIITGMIGATLVGILGVWLLYKVVK